MPTFKKHHMTRIPIDLCMDPREPTVGFAARQARVRVTAASRIHFGLMGFKQSSTAVRRSGHDDRTPATVVRIAPSDNLTIHGADEPRIRELVASWAKYYQRKNQRNARSNCPVSRPRISGWAPARRRPCPWQGRLTLILASTAMHRNNWRAASGVARRSSVGNWGFHVGGCIAELGHPPTDSSPPNY